MPPPRRDQVFISYSHQDTKWREDLEKHLKPYLRAGSTKSWSDKQISPGSQWLTEIKTALTNTQVAVLLVTPDFIASDFIHQYELGPFLKEANQGGVRILWVPVRASSYKKTALKDYQAVLDPAQPLANMTDAERDQAWVKICEEIERAILEETPPPATQSRSSEIYAKIVGPSTVFVGKRATYRAEFEGDLRFEWHYTQPVKLTDRNVFVELAYPGQTETLTLIVTGPDGRMGTTSKTITAIEASDDAPPESTTGAPASITPARLRENLQRLLIDRMSRTEVGRLWYAVLETRMDDEMGQRPKSDCVIELLEQAKSRNKLPRVTEELRKIRPDLADP
jgi:hypothetical protein